MLGVSLQFSALAGVVAMAGTFSARSADQIAEITRLGRLLIGSLLLAAATSLPELTVDLSAVQQGMPDLAAGDLFGSSLIESADSSRPLATRPTEGFATSCSQALY